MRSGFWVWLPGSVSKLMPFGSLLIPATKDQERPLVRTPSCSSSPLHALCAAQNPAQAHNSAMQDSQTELSYGSSSSSACISAPPATATALPLPLLLSWLQPQPCSYPALPCPAQPWSCSSSCPAPAVFASAICTPCCGISLLYVILLQRSLPFLFFFALCFSAAHFPWSWHWVGTRCSRALWENPIDLITVFLSQIIEFFSLASHVRRRWCVLRVLCCMQLPFNLHVDFLCTDSFSLSTLRSFSSVLSLALSLSLFCIFTFLFTVLSL